MEAVDFGFATPEAAASSRIAEAAARGDAPALVKALADNPQADASLSIAWAAENFRMDCLELALGRFEPDRHHAMACALSIKAGNIEALKKTLGDASHGELALAACLACRIGDAQALDIIASQSKRPLAFALGARSAGTVASTPIENAALAGSAQCMAILTSGLPAQEVADNPYCTTHAIELAIRSDSPACIALASGLRPESEEALATALLKACKLDKPRAAWHLLSCLPGNFDATDAIWKCAEAESLLCIPIVAPKAQMGSVDDDGNTLAEAVLSRSMFYNAQGEDDDPAALLQALLEAGAPLPRAFSPATCRASRMDECADIMEAAAIDEATRQAAPSTSKMGL